MSIRKGTNIIAGRSPYQPSLFDFKWSDHILSDPQWARSDNAKWYSSIIYGPAYNHLLSDIEGKEVQSETIEGIIITYYLANDGHKICLTDQVEYLDSLYSLTGIAWYYILDTENQQFKLPRTKWGFTGLRNEVGKYVTPGLPNITGSFDIAPGVAGRSDYEVSGAFVRGTDTSSYAPDFISGSGITRTHFQASASNSIYGNSMVVQPQATEMYLYFYVGNFTENAITNAADLNIEELEDAISEMVATKVAKGHEVIEFQEPTSENEYTWYRLYADGWVEQGGHNHAIQADRYGNFNYIDLPVTMADANYTASAVLFGNYDVSIGVIPGNSSSTRLCIGGLYTATSDTRYTAVDWQVSGMAA